MKNFIKTILIGIIVGIANVIPGVSGGTIIVIFNIYDKFVNAITLNIKKLIQNWKFILPFFIGIGLGIILFSKAITILYHNFPIQTNMVFTGLIIGSIPLLLNYSLKKENNTNFSLTKKVLIILCILLGIFAIFLFDVLQNQTSKDIIQTSLPPFSLQLCTKLFIGGILAAIAMIVPGISGSLLLLTLGIYTTIILSISAFFVKETFLTSLYIIIPTGLGVITGLIVGAKLISFLLKKAPNYTYSVILGLLIGSAYIIFPRFTCCFRNIFTNILCLAIGFSLAYFTTKYSKD